MSPQVPRNRLSYRATVRLEPEDAPLRFMRRRRISTRDRNGDPVDGLTGMWAVALAFAVALVVAALTGLGLLGLLSSDDLTIVANPGDPDMMVVTKRGSVIESYGPATADTASGATLLGQFYRLPNGSLVYVPADETTSGDGVTPVATPTPDAYPTPAPTSVYPTPTPTTVYPTPTPTPFQTSPYGPTSPATPAPGGPEKGSR